MDNETKQILDDHERRIRALEGISKSESKGGKKQGSNKNYTGLAGGIRLLIDESFLNQPKFLGEISTELKRQGYHYSVKSISKALLVDFMKKWQLITRLKENKNWKYVLRK